MQHIVYNCQTKETAIIEVPDEEIVTPDIPVTPTPTVEDLQAQIVELQEQVLALTKGDAV